ncbi:MAG: decaprenyl-phosphate phosphoribosyltransferase [Anaerolineaceae bacterium]|nr:MAG: decaprenyl-phosphate phosphoribosyltransferase [Anaerolineaceae bacterium]
MQAFAGLLKTMRPKQWTKNLLFVFPAIIFDGQLFEAEPFLRVLAAFMLLNMVAGTVYIINDLVDIEADRQHPKKRFRPLPAGELPVGLARTAAVVLPVTALGLSLLLSVPLTLILLAYLLMQIAYSFKLKHVVIVDVLTIMIGFIMRVAAGAAVIDVQNFSPWLYACTGLLALFLAVGKRRQELINLGDNAINTRRIFQEYNLPLIDDMMRMVTTATLITYVLYTVEVPTQTDPPYLGLLTVPFVLYGLFRYLYLIHVRGEGSAPDEVLLKDRALQIAIVLFGLTLVVILYALPEIQA